MKPFYELIARPDIVKVMHAARQDIEIFFLQGGVLPNPLFDSQIAAMVCGFGDAASYETLARKIAKVEIDKSARFTDWSHRPLSKRQLEYALADVTHLCVIYEWMRAQAGKNRALRLGRRGRRRRCRTRIFYKLDPDQSWKRLKPRTSNKRFLGGSGGAGRLARARGPGPRHPAWPGVERRSPDRNRGPSAGVSPRRWNASVPCPRVLPIPSWARA